MFVTVIALKCALLVSRWSYGHFLKVVQFYSKNTINLRHLTRRIYIVIYPQNGDRIVTVGSVTSLRSMYTMYCTGPTTVAFCRTWVVAHRRPTLLDMRKLLVPRTHNILGDRSFSAAGPRLWNDLPPGLRRPGLTFDTFRQSMKTHLFGDRSA